MNVYCRRILNPHYFAILRCPFCTQAHIHGRVYHLLSCKNIKRTLLNIRHDAVKRAIANALACLPLPGLSIDLEVPLVFNVPPPPGVRGLPVQKR